MWEIYEHLLHTITNAGLATALPSKWGVTTTSDLYAAMVQCNA